MATPIYRKIKDLIMQEIEDKAANSPIDSERDMAVRFGPGRLERWSPLCVAFPLRCEPHDCAKSNR